MGRRPHVRISMFVLLAAFVAGCATTDTTGRGPALDRGAKWVMLPVMNHTEVPQAGLRAEAITEALLRAHGVGDLTRYPPALNPDTLLEPTERKVMAEADKWARTQG